MILSDRCLFDMDSVFEGNNRLHFHFRGRVG